MANWRAGLVCSHSKQLHGLGVGGTGVGQRSGTEPQASGMSRPGPGQSRGGLLILISPWFQAKRKESSERRDATWGRWRLLWWGVEA